MSVLPSPPHIPRSPEPTYPQQYIHRQVDPAMKTILASSWRVLEQPPPPTLREILEAYKARGDGDREMLLAMLNAKSSEDQRLASYATLHRTMLDMYAPHIHAGAPVMPPHVPDAPHPQAYAHAHQFPSPPTSYRHSPHAHVSQQLHQDVSYPRHRADSSSSMTDRHDKRYATVSNEQPRKRRRSSRSPPPHYRSQGRTTSSQDGMSVHDLPPSPYSSASSAQSSGGSPRSRESMAINSLLLNSEADGIEDTPKRNTSSERSTTTSRHR
ncbi:hypothetical protein BN946_scf184942.g52 [Trametes cinnabarina]|uniref:Uncharacterized protein n=1 Tax=Pycnoporus cinnabarinus TaxID=5643 RepID=A0A060S710_PYCCI|nr:hypothetical protein BN946_scf184942.g52 [Trametes cinnabarina]